MLETIAWERRIYVNFKARKQLRSLLIVMYLPSKYNPVSIELLGILCSLSLAIFTYNSEESLY